MTPTRRQMLKMSLGAASALAFPKILAAAKPATQPPPKYITCFYQFSNEAVETLAKVLPNGPQFLHIFTQSGPSVSVRAERSKFLHGFGSSFKYGYCVDVHLFKGWMQGDDKLLKEHALRFREVALNSAGPADFFGFNEMPTTGPKKPELRKRAATWLRYLNDPGNGGPKMRGVFYFTEQNLVPRSWQGESDDFWAAIDETCDLVVGEHYHSYEFVFVHSAKDYANHLDELPRWLEASGKPSQIRIASDKYAVLHSSMYTKKEGGWEGVFGKHDLEDLKKYFQFVVDATRASKYGQSRIAFGPLTTPEFDKRALPVLASVLNEDAHSLKI